MSRTLFLDFDGPLHPTTAIDGLKPSKGVLLSEQARQRGMFRWLPLLEQALAAHHDVDVVVHSSWATFASNEELRTVLGSLGERFAGITPRDMGRWEGIEHVIQRFGLEDFRIVDDAIEPFPAGLPQLIAVNPLIGLSDELALAHLRQWLGDAPGQTATAAPAAGMGG